jgi:hypothetical protein
MNENKCNNRNEAKAGKYEAPALEVMEIKLEQHILLSASSGTDDFDPQNW